LDDVVAIAVAGDERRCDQREGARAFPHSSEDGVLLKEGVVVGGEFQIAEGASSRALTRFFESGTNGNTRHCSLALYDSLFARNSVKCIVVGFQLASGQRRQLVLAGWKRRGDEINEVEGL
jgi:hypothetical protein